MGFLSRMLLEEAFRSELDQIEEELEESARYLPPEAANELQYNSDLLVFACGSHPNRRDDDGDDEEYSSSQ